MPADSPKTFYLETFGCQMNVHDSEKVVGTLLAEGYRQVATVEEAELILYNTCSIRDKAEQKVFNRLADFKKLQKQGKSFGVLGCVAQQEGEKIFERAPHVSLVCGSASYRNLPQMLVQLEAGNQRVTGSTTARPTSAFETDSPPATTRTAATSPSSKAATNSAPTAWCRSPAARSAAAPRIRCWRKPGRWPIWATPRSSCSARTSTPTAIRSGKKTFAELLAAVGEVPGIRRVRFTTSHPRDFGRDIVDAIDAVPTLCDHVHLPVQTGSIRVLDAMERLYTRDQYMERIDWMKAAKRDISITTDIIVGFPGETEADFEQTLDLLDEVEYDALQLQVLAASEHARRCKLEDAIPEEEKSRRLIVLQEKQREIQRRRNSDMWDRSMK